MLTLRQRWSNYWKLDMYLPFRFLILLEVCWTLVVCAFIPWYQVSSAVGLEELRLELILFGFHVFAVATIISLLEDPKRPWPLTLLVWLVFTVFTDLWSVLQVWLHTSQIPGIEASFLNGIQAMSIIGICLSGLAVLTYIMTLIRQSQDFKLAGKIDDSSSREETSLLLNNSKINHRIRV